MPWNLVEGLRYGPMASWMIGEDAAGLYDVTYGCQRCHQLGTTMRATNGEIVANPAVTIQPPRPPPCSGRVTRASVTRVTPPPSVRS